MLTVYGTVKSRAMRVLWLLEELGEPYEHIPAAPRAAEVQALNGTGKIPVVVIQGAAMTDSTAILTFLADRAGRFTAPAGTLARARQDALTHAVLDEFDACLWVAARHSFILPPEHRVAAVKDSLKWEFAAAQDRMAARLGEGPFLTGADMTVPDIVLGHCLGWARAAGFPDAPAPLAAYLKRLRARPAFIAASAKG